MSILIKGMRMPETCDECPCHHYHSAGEYVCKATPMFYPFNFANSKGARKEWCPLIELPEEHGDLIDRDELRKKKWTITWDEGKAEYYNAEDIEAAPAVVGGTRNVRY